MRSGANVVGLCLGGLLAGCGLSADEYVPKYVDLECEFALACYDDAVLEFNGWATQDDCVADRGAEVQAEAVQCEFDKGAAKDCLKQFDELACPAEGQDATRPAVCNAVFTNCTEPEDTDASETD